MERTKPRVTSVFRWAGSKKKLLPVLLRSVPAQFNAYYEPFVGSGCLFFAIKPQRAILGDINKELMGTYEILKKHPRILYRSVSARNPTAKEFYSLRHQAPTDLDAVAKASRFLFLNRNCFNGLYRTNTKGEFNVPFGRETGTLPSEKQFYRASLALRQARLDPPYVYADRLDRGEYGLNSFTLSDIQRLIACLKRLDRVGAYFLLSYLECDELLPHISRRWYLCRVPVRRHISGFARFRISVNEVLVSNLPLPRESNASN
jgi:DNA adenine methylase